jgi:hypothetical protein
VLNLSEPFPGHTETLSELLERQGFVRIKPKALQGIAHSSAWSVFVLEKSFKRSML